MTHNPHTARRSSPAPSEILMPEAAVCEANNGDVGPNPTVGVCRDADRLNLWRAGIKPYPRLLSTQRARSASRWRATCSRSISPGRTSTGRSDLDDWSVHR